MEQKWIAFDALNARMCHIRLLGGSDKNCRRFLCENLLAFLVKRYLLFVIQFPLRRHEIFVKLIVIKSCEVAIVCRIISPQDVRWVNFAGKSDDGHFVVEFGVNLVEPRSPFHWIDYATDFYFRKLCRYYLRRIHVILIVCGNCNRDVEAVFVACFCQKSLGLFKSNGFSFSSESL